MAFPKAHKIKLPNGLRVVVVPMKNNPTVTVEVLVEAGSHYEEKKLNGLSHFLEHMCFKGTTNRPSALTITHELDSYGAENNAFTGEEVTGYWAKARAKYFARIFDVVADLYLNPLLPAPDLERERGVIIEEINMYEDMPQRLIHDLIEATMYGPQQPAGRPIIGPKENIRRFTRDDFVTYRATHYVPSKTILVVAGNVEPKEVKKYALEYFGGLPKEKRISKDPVRITQKAPQFKQKEKKTEQTHLAFGFHSYGARDPRALPANVLGAVLGQGMSSRLFQKLREELGVCYYAKSRHEEHTDTGAFKIVAGVDNKRVLEVIGEIVKEIRRLKTERIPDKELKKAKELMIGRLSMGLESSDSLAEFYGLDELMRGKMESPEEAIAKIKKITPAQLKKIANDIFKNKNLNLALIGPKQDTAKIKKLLTV